MTMPIPTRLLLPVVAALCIAAVSGSPVQDPSRSSHDDWWAYRPLARPSVPAVRDTAWVANPVDAFVLARLEAAGLAPTARASDATLIRRAYYDLTGLPPTPEAVAAYAADRDPAKWEHLIDTLLAAPQYGEKWGRHWLDLVRFAETDSFERDRLKPGAWRYRDWVIDAFNQDMPYGRFVTEQLAGDELPDATFSSWVATGYYRLGIWDDEPTDPAQNVYDDLDGIVDTTARVMLATSMGCARCHDHKKDPIPTRDYYRMLAFFEGTSPGKATRRLPVDLGRADAEQEVAAWRIERDLAITEARQLITEARTRLDVETIARLDGERAVGLVAHLPFDGAEIDGARPVEGRIGGAARFARRSEGLRIARPVADDFTLACWFRAEKPGRGNPSDLRWFGGSGLVDAEVPGITDDFGVSLIGGHLAAGVGNPETFVHSGEGFADGEWHHVAFTRERASGRIALYVDGSLVDAATGGTQALGKPPELAIGQIAAGGGLFRGDIDDVRCYARALDAQQVLDLWQGGGFERVAEQAVLDRVGAPEAARYRRAVDRVIALVRPQPELAEVLCVTEERAEVAPSFVRMRGNVHAKGEQVVCGFPQIAGGGEPVVSPPPSGASSGRRLAFARWLVRPDNALTWRAIGNRLWQFHFGRGLVRTPNDFGRLGELPTHPELLDWLATEIVTRGGSMKAMHRLLMTSSAYRMASTPDEAKAGVDPSNDLFWRFDMRRLTAEEVRDSVLAVNGTLNLAMGGPGVYPPMPRAVLETASRPDDAWGRSSPEDAARRTVYIYVKRSLITPLLQAFDLADTDTTCPVRFVTTLPTQALSMMNGDFANQQAGLLAARLTREGADLDARIARGIELVCQRAAASDEIAVGRALYADLLRDHGVSEAEALRLYCLVLLNLDEFVYLD